MIEQSARPTPEPLYEFRLRPDRSITPAGLAVFFLVLAATSIVVVGFSARQGNLFAPAFAALELVLVWLLLRHVWRRQNRLQERIAVTREALTVARHTPGDEVRFHPFWVRVVREPAGEGTARRRLLLTSHGRSVEVGAFLGDEERGQLERLLAGALGALREVRDSGTEDKASG